MDWLHKVFGFLDHYRWTVVGILATVIMAGGALTIAGCKSTTPGLVSADLVGRRTFESQALSESARLDLQKAQLEAALVAYNLEVEALNKRIEAGIEDLDAQDAVRAEFLEAIQVVGTEAAAGTFNPGSLISLGVGLLGGLLGLGGLAAGVTADNRRKDELITKLQNGKE